MLGKVSKWLGIEGVKLELFVAEGAFRPAAGRIEGRIRLQSKQDQTVTAIKVVLIERYARGRKEQQLIDEYELGSLVLKQTLEVPGGGQAIELPFVLDYTLASAPVDEFAKRNPLFGGLAWAARKLRRVNSQYRLEAEANVKGVGLNPFDRKLL